MDYMMIRSVTSSGNSSDIPTQSLGLISDHHNNSHLHHHHHLNCQQPQQTQLQPSYGDNFSTTNSLECGGSSSSSSANISHDPFITLASTPISESSVGSSYSLTETGNDRQPARINILYKSKDVYERIVMSSSPHGSYSSSSSQTKTESSGFSRSNLNDFNKSLYMSPGSFGSEAFNCPSFPASFGSDVVKPDIGTLPGKSKSRNSDKDNKFNGPGSLWEKSLNPNGLLPRVSMDKTKKLQQASSLMSSSFIKRESTSSHLPSHRKRKANSSIFVSNELRAGSVFPYNKKSKFSSPLGRVDYKCNLSKSATLANSLRSRMPNLLKSVGGGNTSEGSTFKGDFFSRKNEIRNDTTNIYCNESALKGSQTSIPIENIFLKKYDPIKLLARLRTSAMNNAAGKSKGAGTKRKVIICNDFPSKRINKRSAQSLKPKSGSYTNSVVNNTAVRRKGNSMMSPISHQFSLPSWSQMMEETKPDIEIMSQTHRNSRNKKKRHSKHHKHRRRIRVKYKPEKLVSEMKIRVMAAFYLKRALDSTRCSAKRRSSRRSKKTAIGSQKSPNKYRKGKSSKNNRHGARVKTERPHSFYNTPNRVSKKLSKPSCGKFQLYQSKLPPPLTVSGKKISLSDNPYLLHTVELLHHKRELQERIESLDSDESVVFKLRPMPELPEVPPKQSLVTSNIPISKREVKHMLSQRLLINLAHVGFTHAKLRPLEVLADVTAQFLSETAKRLKDVVDMELHGVDHGFPDAMERVLNENGIGGTRGLEEFYRNKVMDFRKRMEEQCLNLRSQYAYKVRSKNGLGNSTTSSSTSTGSCASNSAVNSIGGSGSRPANSSSKSACISTSITNTTSSSQPLSPGNSVLAEMLSSQEEMQVKPLTQDSPLAVERQLEELMGSPPPNVEIRPNSFLHSRQQPPLHHLLTSLSQPSQPQPQHRQLLQPQGTLLPSSQHGQPAQLVLHTTSHSLQSQQGNLGTITVRHHQRPAAGFQSPQLFQTSPSPLQSSLQGLHQQQQPTVASQQPNLTQLLQRPITNQASPTTTIITTTPTSHHPQQNHPHSQQNHPHSQQNHPHSQQNHPHSQQNHPHSQQTHPHSQQNHPHSQQNHPHSQPSHPHSQSSHPHSQPNHPHTQQNHPPQQQQHNLILQQQQAQYQGVVIQGGQQAATPQAPSMLHQHQNLSTSPASQRSVSINTATSTLSPSGRQVLSLPLHMNFPKGGPSPLVSNEQISVSNDQVYSPSSVPIPIGPTSKTSSTKGKTVTIIRSGSVASPGDKGRLLNSNQNTPAASSPASLDVFSEYSPVNSSNPPTPTLHQQLQHNNVISINLGSNSIDLDTGSTASSSQQPQTVTMHAVDGSTIHPSQSPNHLTSSSSKAKLKEAINQRNLLRLNFEQVPSAGDSTVLLSSSSGGGTGGSTGNVQFLGKVTSGQSISWNSPFP